MAEMSHLCLDNDFAAASQLQIKYMDLIDALFCEVNPIPIKAAMNLMGQKVGPLRAPLSEMEPEHVKKLSKAMREFGISLAE